MILNQKQKKEFVSKEETKNAYSIVSIRISNDLLKEVKNKAISENRTFSNYVVTKLKS
jgi:predicted DNA binding CopG/RHH family protein